MFPKGVEAEQDSIARCFKIVVSSICIASKLRQRILLHQVLFSLFVLLIRTYAEKVFAYFDDLAVVMLSLSPYLSLNGGRMR